jgi:hypothetical protein
LRRRDTRTERRTRCRRSQPARSSKPGLVPGGSGQVKNTVMSSLRARHRPVTSAVSINHARCCGRGSRLRGNDPARFWRHVLAALDEWGADLSTRVGPLSGPPASARPGPRSPGWPGPGRPRRRHRVPRTQSATSTVLPYPAGAHSRITPRSRPRSSCSIRRARDTMPGARHRQVQLRGQQDIAFRCGHPGRDAREPLSHQDGARRSGTGRGREPW